MLATANGVRRALSGTVLDSASITSGPGDLLLVEGLTGDVLTSWRAARAAVPQTGRWPVAVWDPGSDDGTEHRAPTRATVTQLATAAPRIDPWARYRPFSDETPIGADDLEVHFEAWFPDTDLEARAVRDLAPPTTDDALHTWIYRQMQSDPAVRATAEAHAAPLIGTRCWFEPGAFAVALLPTAHGWLAPAWIDFFDESDHQEELCAALWRWHQRWGAELVAHWGTMMQFVVDRPPGALTEENWELTGQLLGVGRYESADRWLLAAAVATSDAWFVHNRP